MLISETPSTTPEQFEQSYFYKYCNEFHEIFTYWRHFLVILE